MNEELPGSARRLAEELAEDGIELDGAATLRDVLLEDLDYARRIPAFEGRRPLYGSIVMPDGSAIDDAAGVGDIVPLDGLTQAMARTFADGRSAFLVHRPDDTPVLACFDRPVQYESELVRLQQATGARIVQRTAVLGQVRLFTERRVISWDGRDWTERPTAAALVGAVQQGAPNLDPTVAHGLLDLTVHWLSPAHVGATIVVHEEGFRWDALDVATKSRAPRLSLTSRRHFPALFAALSQHDLATLATSDGSVMYLGVGLRTSDEAERHGDTERGMRHRSAQRFSYDHPSTTIAVVSEDGPVTVFRGGQALPLEITD